MQFRESMKYCVHQNYISVHRVNSRRKNEVRPQPRSPEVARTRTTVQKEPAEELHEIRTGKHGGAVPADSAGCLFEFLRKIRQSRDALRVQLDLIAVALCKLLH